MDKLAGKRILIFQQRGWAINIGHFLAKKLQGEGCRLAAFTLKRTTHEFVVNQQEVKYDYIISNDDIMENPKKFLQSDVFSLREICDDLGVDTIWPMVYSLRNHVKSYKDKYYYGFKQNVSDDDIVDYIMAIYKFIKFIFAEFSPEVIIAPNIIALQHIMLNLYAQKKGVEMISVTDSKVKGYSIFSLSYQDDRGAFFDRADELNNLRITSPNAGLAERYIGEFRNNFAQPDGFVNYVNRQKKKKTLIQKIRFELSPYKQVLRWHLKGPSKNYIKSFGVSMDYKPPKYILRDHYCEKKYKKFMDNYSYYPMEKIKQYVYFPLQFQPEATIDTAAPYFCNQIETARQAAMSMPGDFTLLVKEHPAMVGLRPPSYIEKVARTPNVKLVDYRIPSEKILRNAALVISPSSTTIAEAAFLRKPAIQLGNLGTTLKLPNVFKYSDMSSLARKIKEILRIDLRTDEYERKLRNFVAAVYDTGFDFKYSTVWEKGKGDNMENLWRIYEQEIKRVLYGNEK